jgi:ribosome-associated protein
MDLVHLQKEVQYKAIRSAGPGGQHVNKVSSKIVLTLLLPRRPLLQKKSND